jgi:hypothetical protein
VKGLLLAYLCCLLVTILAFIFVPLSLATSFFGMNIQELNSEGQPIWVFVMTASGILLAAFFGWVIFYQWNKYIHAPDLTDFGRLADNFTFEAKVHRWERVRLGLWLNFHGHFVWFWRSGIIFSLFTKGKKGFVVTCDAAKKGCTCPPRVYLNDIMKPNEYDGTPGSSSSHSPHSPVAYIYAHAHMARGRPSRKAFSFANAD